MPDQTFHKYTEAQRQDIVEFYVIPERLSADFVATKLWKGRSGYVSQWESARVGSIVLTGSPFFPSWLLN